MLNYYPGFFHNKNILFNSCIYVLYLQQDTELNELRMTIEALKRQSKMTLADPVMSPAVSRRHTSPAMKDLHITPGGSSYKLLEPDPPENCHLTVKKLPKTSTFFSKKIDKNCHFFKQNYLPWVSGKKNGITCVTAPNGMTRKTFYMFDRV